jgi:hypothetical protein
LCCEKRIGTGQDRKTHLEEEAAWDRRLQEGMDCNSDYRYEDAVVAAVKFVDLRR